MSAALSANMTYYGNEVEMEILDFCLSDSRFERALQIPSPHDQAMDESNADKAASAKFDVDNAILAIAALSCPNMTRDRHNRRLEDDARARAARAKVQDIRDARLRQDGKEVASAKGLPLIWRLRNVDRAAYIL